MASFEFKIALINTITYAIGIGSGIYAHQYINSFIKAEIILITNPWLWLALSCILVFTLSLLILKIKEIHFNVDRSIILCSIYFICMWMWLSAFKPFPNTWILGYPFVFALITSASVYIHNYDIDAVFKFITNTSISENIKLARIKMEYETWNNLLKMLLSGYILLAITYAVFYPDLMMLVVDRPSDNKLLVDIFWFSLIANAIVFLYTLCKEILVIMNKIKDKIVTIPKDPPLN